MPAPCKAAYRPRLQRERIRRRTYKTRDEARRSVRLRRDVLQSGAQAGHERDAVTRRVQTAAYFASGRHLEN